MQEVAKMVAQSCSTCSKAMRAEGIKVQSYSSLLKSAVVQHTERLPVHGLQQ